MSLFLSSLSLLGIKLSLGKSVGENKKYLNSLISRRFGVVEVIWINIFNFSNITLTGIEVSVLSRGLDFCILPSKIFKEHIFTEFEMLYSQLNVLFLLRSVLQLRPDYLN